ncbi:DUF6993 domain-containing protein [Arthrobacter sp. NPDC090010]|uniref:DUF6993 domain-containing protein n=1 Tax=Arthrobacter sp. NPDC090010 TaxID=3363942 RepID=UPI0037F4ADF1
MMQRATFPQPSAMAVTGDAVVSRRMSRAMGSVGLVLAALMLAACSSSPVVASDGASGSSEGSSSAQSVPASHPVEPTATPPSAAEQARRAVQEAVQKSLGGVSNPSSDALRAAISGAAPKGAAVQVSHSTTPTGLQADSLVGAAVVAKGSCAFVYVRDGKISSALLPVLADGSCFIGDQH